MRRRARPVFSKQASSGGHNRPHLDLLASIKAVSNTCSATAVISRRIREDHFAADIGAVRPTEAKGRRRPRLGLVDLDTGEINIP
jgi:hypothetical protein